MTHCVNSSLTKMLHLKAVCLHVLLACACCLCGCMAEDTPQGQPTLVLEPGSEVTKTGAVAYGFDATRKHLLKLPTKQAAPISMLALSDVGSQCTRFSGLQLLDSSDYLAVICDQNNDQFTQTVMLIDLALEVPVFSVEDTFIDLSERIQWVGQAQFLVRNNSVSFTLFNLQDSSRCFFEIVDENLNYQFQSGFFVDGSRVFVPLEGNGWENPTQFNLADISKCGESQITAYSIAASVMSSGPVVVSEQGYYFLGRKNMETFSKNFTQRINTSYLLLESSLLDDEGALQLVYSDAPWAILRGAKSGQLYRLNIITSSLTQLD